MSMRNIQSLGDLHDKTVLLRADFNVPLKDSVITDDGRIKAALPTLKLLLDSGAKVVIAAHLGRPKGEVKPEFSLKPVAKRLSELVDAEVLMATDTVGDSATELKKNLKAGQILLLENVRFNPAETSKDEAQRKEFAQKLVSGVDCFVSDGFGVVHRKQASVYDVAKLVPSAAGLLVEKEIKALSKAIEATDHPYTVILGGAKVKDKLGVIENLIDKADKIIVGGGMAYTFLQAEGKQIGQSLVDLEQIETVKAYIQKAKENNVELLLPVDVVVAKEITTPVETNIVSVDEIPQDLMGLDIGVLTRQKFAEAIEKSKICVWNGPMGVFELVEFAEGTKAVAQALADTDAFTIIGGGDSAAAVRLLGFKDEEFSHISTGGGASLELLEGKVLPGIAVLED